MSLSARHLCLSLSGIPLLKEIDLDVEPGKITTILGPNGAGKTSLLRALVGELAPTTDPHPYSEGAVRYFKDAGIWTEANDAQQAKVSR